MKIAFRIPAVLSVLALIGCASDAPPAASSATAPAPAPAPTPAPTPPPISPEVLARIDADLVRISPGTLPSRYERNGKRPEIHIGAFFIAKHEVTQQDWSDVMGGNPSAEKDDPLLPVTRVSWRDAHKYIDRLNQAKGGTSYRLPTAREWEFACRAGAAGHVPMQANDAAVSRYAWWGKNSGERSHPVGKLKPNAFGLYDILGNVAEWCEDAEDPTKKDKLRVNAGGNFDDANLVGQDCSTTSWLGEEGREQWTGFRLAKTAPAQPAAKKAKPSS